MQSVDFNVADLDLLAEAIKAAGYRIATDARQPGYIQFTDDRGQYGTFQNGQFRVPAGIDTDAIKRQYSRQVIGVASKRYGWKISQGAAGKLQLKKGRF